MKYIEAPNVYESGDEEDFVYQVGDGHSIFLAGGICDCPDWQSRMVELLTPTDMVVINPRRKDFPIRGSIFI